MVRRLPCRSPAVASVSQLWSIVSGKKDTGKIEVYSVAFSPDGKTLASGTGRSIRLWELATLRNSETIEGHRERVQSVAFTPDGQTLASASFDQTIKLWDVARGKNTAIFKASNDLTSVAISPDGKTLAASGWGKTVELWSLTGGRSLGTLIRPDVTLTGHTERVESVAFSPDGKTLASGSADSTIRLWDTGPGKNAATLDARTPGASGGISVAFRPDGKILAFRGCGGNIRLWDAATGKNIFTAKCYTRYVLIESSASYTPGGNNVTITVKNTAEGKPFPDKGHTNSVESLAFSPDGKTLASGSSDTTVKLWSLKGDDWNRKATSRNEGEPVRPRHSEWKQPVE